MEQDQAIRSGVTASVLVHLLVLALILISTEVHPLSSASEPIAIDIVTPEEMTKPAPVQEPEPERKPITLPDLSVLSREATATPPAQATPPPASAPQLAAAPQAAPAQAAAPKTGPSQPAAAQGAASPSAAATQQAQPVPAAKGQAVPMASFGAPSTGYKQPEPDVTIKYQVMLGLPGELPPPSSRGTSKSDEGFDATESSSAADLTSNVIGEFRRHLKSCSKLPATVAPTDHIVVKLRVFMKPDGRLAAEPAIGGGSANMKAISMLQSAIAALKDCQPYTMLPADRYGEWKVLDLNFTPKDFSG